MTTATLQRPSLLNLEGKTLLLGDIALGQVGSHYLKVPFRRIDPDGNSHMGYFFYDPRTREFAEGSLSPFSLKPQSYQVLNESFNRRFVEDFPLFTPPEESMSLTFGEKTFTLGSVGLAVPGTSDYLVPFMVSRKGEVTDMLYARFDPQQETFTYFPGKGLTPPMREAFNSSFRDHSKNNHVRLLP